MVAYHQPMQSWDDDQLAILRPNYPRWDLWAVRCWPNHTVWCARPKGSPIATINTDSPEHLIDEIRQQEQDALQRPE
jgi:hypothetical protein